MSEERWALDGFELHNRPAGLKMRGAEVNPAAKKPNWVDSPNADGAVLLEDPRSGNRVHTYTLAYDRMASMDDALAALGELVDKLEACSRTAGGLDLVWTPQGSTKSATFKALLGEISDLPVEIGGQNSGWFRNGPVVIVTITCAPFGDLAAVAGTPESATDPIVGVSLAGVDGDAPADTTTTITETGGTQPLRWAEWGAGTDTTSPVMLAASDLDLTNASGALTVDAEGADGNVVNTSFLLSSSTPTVICRTGSQPHVGEWRVIARVRIGVNGKLRLKWRAGAGDYTANSWVGVSENLGSHMARVDLGLVTIPAASQGAQEWDGAIEGYGSSDMNIAELYLLPTALGYGYASGEYTYRSGFVDAYDAFDSALGDLDGNPSSTGETWATSGAATDLSTSAVGVTSRSATGSRTALLGATSYADVDVGIEFTIGGVDGIESPGAALLARYVDSSNYLELVASYVGDSFLNIDLKTIVGGSTADARVVATIDGFDVDLTADQTYTFRLVAYASGFAFGLIYDSAGALIGQGSLNSTDLATGGALETGQVGFLDLGNGTNTRTYDDFYAGVPAPLPIVAEAGRDARISTNEVNRRESADGTTWGPLIITGNEPVTMPAGNAGTSTRVVALAHANDLGSERWTTFTPNFDLTVDHTPRVKVVPR